jgi:hypothetical protein
MISRSWKGWNQGIKGSKQMKGIEHGLYACNFTNLIVFQEFKLGTGP